MVQIALKPLTRLGLDCPIFMALRDNRLIRYKDSLLAMIQTNICSGPGGMVPVVPVECA